MMARNPFLIPELLCSFLECLSAAPLPLYPGPSEEQRTLAVLARTCRAFSEPSLDCLWKCLNSLLPLIRCCTEVGDKCRVKITPSHSEWLVIERHSSRIQDLTLGNDYASLYFLQHTGLVLPNLRVFRWKCPRVPRHPARSFSFPWPWLITQVVALEVELNTVNDPNYLLFSDSYYPLVCSNLESIRFDLRHDARDHSSISQTISRRICNDAAYKHVTLSLPIGYTVLKHLGKSPTLKTVALKLAPQESPPDRTYFGPQDIPFRNVTNLALTLGNSPNFVTYLLRPHGQAFHSFRVTLYTLAFYTEISTLLIALASPQRIRSLQSVVIDHIPYTISRSTSDIEEMPIHHYLTREVFHPLVPLIYLRELVIHMNNPVSLNDEEFASLVCHWPLLEILKMMWVHKAHPMKSITLKGLLSLLASCQKLHQIGLTLDARDVPAGTYVHSDVCRPFIISPIMVCNSPLARPDMVAAFLSRHLPSMPCVHPTMIWISPRRGGGCYCPPYRRLWSQVNEHLKRLREIPEDASSSMFARLRRYLRRSDDKKGTPIVDLDAQSLDDFW